MTRLAAISLGLVLVGWSAPTRGADPAKDIVGTWEGRSGAGGFTEVWTIEHDKGAWTVRGVFKKGDDEVGSFTGKNPRFAGGALTFVQEYVKKPVANWNDGSTITARASGDKLTFTWRAGKNSGSNSLDRQGTAVAAKPADAPPTEPKRPDPRRPGPKGTTPAPEPKKAEPAVELSPEAKKELDGLAGCWNFKEFTFDGKKYQFGIYWTFEGGKVIESLEPNKGQTRRSGLVTQLDPGKKFIEVNFTSGVGGSPTGKFQGVYEQDGDTLKVCLAGLDHPAPTAFESTAGSGAMLMVFKKVKK
jgi:uncharacterized protein (TIGR03067 family)